MKFNIPDIVRRVSRKKQLTRTEKLDMLAKDIAKELAGSTFERETLPSKDLAYVLNKAVDFGKGILEERACLHYAEYVNAEEAQQRLNSFKYEQ